MLYQLRVLKHVCGFIVLGLVTVARTACAQPYNADEKYSIETLRDLDLGSESDECVHPHRKVKFETTELTIQNLDISSDGQRVVFDMLGDLYVVPTNGGSAMPLTRGLGWDVRPVWSPNRKFIAFISDRTGSDQVFLIDSTGRGPVRQLTSGEGLLRGGAEELIGSVEWMPDSSAVIAEGRVLSISDSVPQQQGGGIKKYASDRSIFSHYSNGFQTYSFRFQPSTGPASADGGISVWKFDDKSGSWRDENETFPAASLPMFDTPSISPDGRWLIYKQLVPVEANTKATFPLGGDSQNALNVVVRDRKSGEIRLLLGPGIASGWNSDGVKFNGTGRFAITPDSQFLIAPFAGGLHKIDIESGDIQSVPVNATVAACLDPIAEPHAKIEDGTYFTVRNFRNASLHPSRSQMLFSALRRIYVVDSANRIPRVLASQEEGQFHPSYSPDGKWVAYVSWSETEGGHLWRVPSQGGSPERLTQNPGYYQTPVWSPDGEKIAFAGSDDIRTRRQHFEGEVYEGTLRVISIKERKVHDLKAGLRLGHSPSFSSDGARIFYNAYAVGGAPLKIYSIPTEGGDSREEVLSGALSTKIGEQAVPSPDGRYVAITTGGDLHLGVCRESGGRDESVASCTTYRITSDGAYDARWRANGTELEWSFSDKYYRANVEDLYRWLEFGTHGNQGLPILESVVARLAVPRVDSQGTVVLDGARIITMRGDEVIENGFVRIVDGKIAQVGRSEDLTVSSGIPVIDLKGKTLLPGFVDAHAHITLPRDLLDGNNSEALLNLAFGITTAKDPSAADCHFVYDELIKSGSMVGPRLFVAEALVSYQHTIQSLDDAIGIARRTRRLGGTYLKYHTGWNRQQRRWIMEAARETGLGVAAHWPATNYEFGRLNITTVFDGATSHEHALADSQDMFGDYAELIAKSGASINVSSVAGAGGYPQIYWKSIEEDPRIKRFFVGRKPRLLTADTHEEALAALFPVQEGVVATVREISKRGGNVAIGSHGNYDGVGFHFEMWAHVHGGMSPHSVLRAATLHGARAIGVESQVGSIEVGKLADLVILDENPLVDIRRTLSVVEVMQGGVLRDAKTLDEVWPERAALPEWRMAGNQMEGEEPHTSTDH